MSKQKPDKSLTEQIKAKAFKSLYAIGLGKDHDLVELKDVLAIMEPLMAHLQLENRPRFEIKEDAKSVSLEVFHIISTFEKYFEELDKHIDGKVDVVCIKRKHADAILVLIDRQMDSVSNIVPCRMSCARDVEATYVKIKELLGDAPQKEKETDCLMEKGEGK